MARYQTEQRRALAELFEQSSHRAFSVQELYAELQGYGISVSAIYRNLADMERQGLVCKIAKKGHKSALYQYVDPHHCAGVIHLKCHACDATFHLNQHVSQMVLGMAAQDFAFEVNSAAVLYGECDSCSQFKRV